MSKNTTIKELLSYRISAVANAMSRGAAAEFRKRFKITLGEWRVLGLLGETQPRSVMEVSRSANLDAGQTSRVVASLSKRGLILRDQALGAGRPIMLTLTSEGEGLYERLIAVARARNDIFKASLSTAELDAFDSILIKLGKSAKSVAKGEVPLMGIDLPQASALDLSKSRRRSR
jgi:DNA-binding MarR family transcriptional regulator